MIELSDVYPPCGMPLADVRNRLRNICGRHAVSSVPILLDRGEVSNETMQMSRVRKTLNERVDVQEAAMKVPVSNRAILRSESTRCLRFREQESDLFI